MAIPWSIPKHDKPYGTCPICGAIGVTRERRPNGDDKCAKGHVYPSRDAITPTPEPRREP